MGAGTPMHSESGLTQRHGHLATGDTPGRETPKDVGERQARRPSEVLVSQSTPARLRRQTRRNGPVRSPKPQRPGPVRSGHGGYRARRRPRKWSATSATFLRESSRLFASQSHPDKDLLLVGLSRFPASALPPGLAPLTPGPGLTFAFEAPSIRAPRRIFRVGAPSTGGASPTDVRPDFAGASQARFFSLFLGFSVRAGNEELSRSRLFEIVIERN